MITHDRYFLDNVTGWILELDRGRGIPLRGQLLRPGWSQGQAPEQEEREDEARQKALARELEWIRPDAKARQAKSKARIKRAMTNWCGSAKPHDPTKAQIVIPVARAWAAR
jgi:ATPase subunit of ABC transporter with duplicated ATPase domains